MELIQHVHDVLMGKKRKHEVNRSSSTIKFVIYIIKHDDVHHNICSYTGHIMSPIFFGINEIFVFMGFKILLTIQIGPF